jgi:hypothetical protein
VGLDYSALSDLQTLPIKHPEATNYKYRVASTLVELLDTMGLKFGADFSAKLRTVTTGEGGASSIAQEGYVSGDLITPVTDDREWGAGGDRDTRVSVCIRADGAYPATVTGLTHLVEFDHV